MNRYNLKKLIKFDIFYKLVSVAVVYPCFVLVLKLTLKMGNIPYLTNEYIYKYMTKPATIAGMALILMLILLVIQMEQEFICAGHETLYGEKIRVAYLLENGFDRMWHVLRPANILSVFVTGIVVLTMNLSVVYNIIINVVNVQTYVAEGIKTSIDVRYFLAGILVVMFLVTIMGIFVSPVMYDKKYGFFRAIRESISISLKNLKKIVGLVIGYNIMVALIMILLYVLITVIVFLGIRILDIHQLGAAVYLTVIRYFTTLLNIVLCLVCIPASFFVIARFYEKWGQQTGKQEENRIVSRKQYHNSVKLIIIVACLLDCFYLYLTIQENYFWQIDFLRIVEITSHRGSSINMPENTMAAFEQAVDDLTDYIELDVRQTADGRFVVIHDENLKRTTGVNALVGELTQEQICALDADYEKNENYEGLDVTVPSLEEVLDFTRGKLVRLNIELKTSRLDQDYAEKIYEILCEYDMIDSCVITSSDYGILKEMKQLDEDIETGYILTVAMGNYYDMDSVDFFSVDYRFVTTTMIYILHSMDKEIHIWTLNDENDILKYANMGADNIITDNPILAREVIYSKDAPDIFVSVLRYVFGN